MAVARARGAMPVDFSVLPVWQNVSIFAVAAASIWAAGSRLSHYADALADRTGFTRALIGLVLLAGATELPELATTVSAALVGNASLAVHNMFGGVVMQTAVIAVADLVLLRGALTWFAPRPLLLLEGNLLVVLLALALAAVSAGEAVSVGGVGLWPVLLLLAYGGAMWLLQRYDPSASWQPVDAPEGETSTSSGSPSCRMWSLRRLTLAFIAASLVILLAGVTLAWVGDALAVQTGLGSSFVGATLLAASTSLPELSTTLAAVRIGSYSMAISNIFGSNMIMVALLLPADLAYREGPILSVMEETAVFTIAVGIVATTLYLIGLVERRDRTILRMGYDSAAVLALYLGSLVALYLMD